MYFPNAMFGKFLSNGFDMPSENHAIEPSYRFESDSKEAYLEVELPGVEKEDISVDVNNHHLTVTAKRVKESLLDIKKTGGEENGNSEKAADKDAKHVMTYTLNVRIGHDADVSKISSVSYKNGVLVLRIPSQTKDNTRRITID